MKPLLCVFLAAAPLIAAAPPSTTVTGPVLGSLFDAASGRVRPLAGIPASAVLSDPAGEGPTLTMAVAAPAQPFAIGVEAETGAALLVSASERIELPGVRSGASRIALSPRGRSAALFFADSRSVQLVAGLPDRVRVVREVPLGGTPSALAVSDDGETLLAALEEDGGAVLVMDRASEGYQSLGSTGPVAALEFFPDSGDALCAEAGSVWSIRNGQVLRLMAEDEGIEGVVGVAASGDGLTVFAAMRSGQVAIRNLATGEQTAAACSCRPDGLSRLRGNAVFRLNGLGEGPVWILDAGGAEPRILFVAAPARGDQ